MWQRRLSEIAEKLAAGYPTQDFSGIHGDIYQVLQIVLPSLGKKALYAKHQGKDSTEEIWKTIKGGAESEFEKALQQIDRLKVLYVTSKFMNNKSVGTAITEIVLESAESKEE